MNKLKFLVAILFSLTVFGLTSSEVIADTYGQSDCTSTYGQNGCVVGETTQPAKGTVYLADTALDTPSLMAVGALMLSGAGAFVLKKKLA